MTIPAILYILTGWIAGALINHAADILPRRETLRQRPRCTECGAPRPATAWSAALALLTRQQQCTRCGHPRQQWVRAVAVELVMPGLFVFLWWKYGLSLQLGLVSLYTAILVLITVTDLEHRLIFHRVILPSILFGIAAAFFTPNLHWLSALVGGVTAFILAYLAALLARGGLGGGDVTLSAFLGLIIGFPRILLSLTFGVFLGGFVAFLLLVTRRVGLKTFIPYGPFLTITGWLMLIWGTEIWDYYF